MMEIRELWTGMYHPLDHWPFTKECESWHGGWRNHLRLTWTLRRKDQIMAPYMRLLRCPFGKHDWVIWWTWSEGAQLPEPRPPQCRYCNATRKPTSKEQASRFC